MLREIVERSTKALDVKTHVAFEPEHRADTDAIGALTAARARFLKSAESFLPPCLQEAVLANLARADPLAPPTFDPDLPDQTKELDIRRQLSDENHNRIRAGLSSIREDVARTEVQRAELRRRVDKLSRRAERLSNSGGTASLLEVSSLNQANESENGRRNESVLRERGKFLDSVEAQKAALASKIAALRDSVASTEADIAELEQEQEAAAAAAASAASVIEAARQTETMAGVADMTDTELEEAVQKESELVQRNTAISEWYRATVVNLEQVGGVRISSSKLSGARADGEENQGGIELMVELGDSGQVMEVTISAVDGSLGSVQTFALQGDDKSEGLLTQSDVEELASLADELPAPANLRFLVREALNRSKCTALRHEHIRLMRRRYLVGYRPGLREVTITMPAGIVASFRLHPDYPMVAGGAEIMSLTGVGGWSPNETERLCRSANALALTTLMDVMDWLQKGVAELEGGG